MVILKTLDELLRWRALIDSSKSIGFVPTMGALHEGHLSLVKKSMDECDVSCVSIFINPKQFGDGEDLESYPQDLDEDLKKIKKIGVEAVFVPKNNDIYSKDDSLLLTETRLSMVLEGKSRPQFFSGVLTVVSKLFNLVQPTSAYFGMKDAQQLIVIQKMVDDMKYPINIVPCKTVREHNGLAMSSRNEYLNREERDSAKIIYLSLLHAKQLIHSGESNPKIIKGEIENMILSVSGFNIDYISIADSKTLLELDGNVTTNSGAIVSLAVFLNEVRLIDNIYI